ncbi:MAG: electron transfer flavoprotein subunit alpha/FixB family protein [Actinomycetota bacterium]
MSKPAVWTLIEQNDNQIAGVSWELIGKGRELADDLGGELCGVLVGHNVKNLATEAFYYGADKVYVIDDPVLAYYRTEPYAHGISELAKKHKPDVFLMAATTLGRDLSGAVATQLSAGLTADCTVLEIDPETKLLHQTRPAFGGNIMATIFCATARPQMSSVRPRLLPVPERDTKRTGEVVEESLGLKEEDVKTRRLEFIPDEGMSVNIEDAEYIVSGGRGLGSPEGFETVRDVAEALGGTVGSSRPPIDAGWMPYAHQVGMSGHTVRPKVYIAAGISGAVHHLVAMEGSDMIIAINKDPEAPIFKTADYAVVADLYEVLPALTAEIKKRRKGAK